MSRLAIGLGFLLTVFLLSGCGDNGPVRHEVTGRVVFDHKPLDEGLIDFEPLDNQGTKSGAKIVNGEYRIPRDKGLFPGRYRVTIIGGDGSSGAGNADPGPARPAAPRFKGERIPPDYNLKSKITREVTTDGPNQFDFTIPKRSA